MDEYEIKNEYNSLKKISDNSGTKNYIEKIEHIKNSLTPKQYIELKSLLVNSSNHHQSFKTTILKRLDKKIDEFSLKNDAVTDDEIKKLDTNIKISRSKSIRRLRLKPKKFQTRKYRKTMKLSPIIEVNESPESQKKSTGGRRNLRKTIHSRHSMR